MAAYRIFIGEICGWRSFLGGTEGLRVPSVFGISRVVFVCCLFSSRFSCFVNRTPTTAVKMFVAFRVGGGPLDRSVLRWDG